MNKGYLSEREFLSDFFSDRLAEDVYATALMAKIGMVIADKRHAMGMTQKAFASFIGVCQGRVAQFESGECNFSLRTLAQILAKLDLMPVLEIRKADGSMTLLHNLDKEEDSWKFGDIQGPLPIEGMYTA